MKIAIRGIKGHGDLDRERLVLTVLRDDDVGNYAVFDTTFADDGGVSNKLRHAFWFPDKQVHAGDLVVLYTKKGRPKEKLTSGRATTHFFYWGLEAPIWKEERDCAVLLLIKDWVAREAVTP